MKVWNISVHQATGEWEPTPEHPCSAASCVVASVKWAYLWRQSAASLMFSVSLQWWTLQMSPTAKQTTRTNSISSLFSSESFDAVTLLLLLFTCSTLGCFFFFQLHNWAEIMGNIWNGTLVLLYLLTAFPRVCSQGCTSNISSGAASQGQIWKPFFFFLQYRVLAFRQRQASRPRFSQHLLTGGGRGR